MPKLPQRTNLELSLFCKDIVGDYNFSNYFKNMAEIQTASSLSKNGFLMNLVNTLKKELADVPQNHNQQIKVGTKGKVGRHQLNNV